MTVFEARFMRDLEEARGRLLDVHETDGRCIASFEWGKVCFPEDLIAKLIGLVGRDVACLRLDGKFYIRVV